MTGIEERLRAEGRALSDRATTAADTDHAWAQLRDTSASVIPLAPARTWRRWIGTAAAAVLVAAGVGTTVLVGGDGNGGEPTASSPASQASAADVGDARAATPTTLVPMVPVATTVAAVGPLATTGPAEPGTPEAGTASLPATHGTSLSDTTTSLSPDDPGRSCTYTDPARRPINVARALACPDGTRVWVEGVVVERPDGTRVLCSEAAADGTRCDGGGLQIVGHARGGIAGAFEGTKRGDELVLCCGPMNVPTPACSLDAAALPFVATALPRGFSPEVRPGAGGVITTGPDGSAAPIEPRSPPAVHYAGDAGRRIDVVHSEFELPSSRRTITVLGAPALLGEIGGRMVVVAAVADARSRCGSFSFVASGLTEEELVAFVEGLQPAG